MTGAKPCHDESICVRCGLCCDGTLFERAPVAVGEEARMTDSGLELFEDEGNTFFRLPCRHLSCARCTIYETRFRICRTFECGLLVRLREGDLTTDEASAKIAEAKRLLAEVADADPQAQAYSSRKALRARLAEGLGKSSGEVRVRNSRRLLNIIALDTFFDRWFHDRSTDQAPGARR